METKQKRIAIDRGKTIIMASFSQEVDEMNEATPRRSAEAAGGN